MMQDPIADMLSKIKNASIVKKSSVEVGYSNQKNTIMNVFVKNGYVDRVEKIGEKPKYLLKIYLKYNKKESAISNIERISKPGLRIYAKHTSIPRVFGGRGVVVISTPSGIMTGKEARKKRIGGEIICKVW